MLSRDERRSFIDVQHEELSVRAQCDLWGIQRSSAYYVPVEINSETLAIMNLIDQMYMDCPYYGARKFIFFGNLNVLVVYVQFPEDNYLPTSSGHAIYHEE